MHQYFQRALLYNYGLQLYTVFLTVAVISPLYMKFYTENDPLLNGLIIIIILIMKAWNLIINWHLFKLENKSYVLADKMIRLILSILVFYMLFSGKQFLIAGLIYIIYLNIVYFTLKKEKSLRWEKLIDNDAHRIAQFYRFVSLFATVPQMKNRLRKRRLLSAIVQKITSYKKANTFTYLHRLTFIRGGEFFSLFIRLTILGAFAVILIPNKWVSVAIAILFIYMTSFQMLTLYFYHRTNMWPTLYPIDETEKRSSFLHLVIQLTFIQTLMLAIVLLIGGDILQCITVIGLGVAYNYVFHFTYAKSKIQTMT